MKKLIKSLFVVALLCLPASFANASIILAGDVNIGNPLDGSSGAPIDAGNATFFNNILGTGTSVVMDGDGYREFSAGSAFDAINNHYNSLIGVTSTVVNGGIAGALGGADLLISYLPDDSFSAAELADMAAFKAGGGTILFMGDNGFLAAENNRINAALSALGSSMSLLNTTFDAGFTTATGSQIATHPLTAGVSSFTYAAPSEAMVSGGTALFFGTGSEPFVAVESLSGPVVPEPGTLIIWSVFAGTGLAFGSRRRRV